MHQFFGGTFGEEVGLECEGWGVPQLAELGGLVEKGLIAAMANNAGTGFCQFDGDSAAYAFTGAQYHGCLACQLAGGHFAWDG